MEQFYKTGFLRHLESLEVDTIVIFGSFSRADWHTKSDIDIFILGSDEKMEKSKYERLLKREIQLFTFKNKKEIQKTNPYLINNITNGYFIKGNVQSIIGNC